MINDLVIGPWVLKELAKPAKFTSMQKHMSSFIVATWRCLRRMVGRTRLIQVGSNAASQWLGSNAATTDRTRGLTGRRFGRRTALEG